MDDSLNHDFQPANSLEFKSIREAPKFCPGLRALGLGKG